ncbi:hypothetical protein GCM10009827_088960 [Dactylosporangium maewongense]|uniref:Secreted protein n=1 Tax=Dactylosporangium maewongense TaxID=634393 RepID=A0ABN2C8F2_9ACTN
MTVAFSSALLDWLSEPPLVYAAAAIPPAATTTTMATPIATVRADTRGFWGGTEWRPGRSTCSVLLTLFPLSD